MVDAHVQKLEPELSGMHFDALLDASFSGHPVELWVEAKTNVYPRDAREQVSRWQRMEATPEQQRRRHLLVAAQNVSPGAREVLAREGVGYFDQGGSLCLPFSGAYTLIDKPSEKTSSRHFELFTDARKPVLQAMLLNPELGFTVHDLASRTGSSGATVSKLMAHLEQDEWVTAEGSGPFKRRKLAKPGDVLDAWVAAETAALPHRKERRFFVPGRKGTELPELITKAVLPDAARADRHFTAEAAAHRYAPYLTTWTVTTMRAIPQLTNQLPAAIGAVEVDQGYNLLVIEDSLASLRFVDAAGPIPLASRVQTYVDLMCTPGRAPDAARHLREQVLKF
ncbi:helix-turn-helix domain-containing protein [Variovorax sp. KK3]|uniref:MarR family transcriptional regulator n=1 Tax=Variovorax sp. KK3 TaxID=1855728 RepID=UPI00117EF6CB|nr:hypothetical protein [Variovorax sp. KK3]